MSERLSRKRKLLIAQQAGYRCEYCLAPVRYCPDPFSVEHIKPRSLGGGADQTNLAYACQGCNGRKFTATHALDPITGESVPLYHPRRDRWLDHFRWQDDGTVIVGTSPSGRATVERLKLNRDEVVNLRRILRQLGLHSR